MEQVKAFLGSCGGSTADFNPSVNTQIRDYGFRIIQQPESGLSTDQSESSDVMIIAKKSTDSSTRPPTPPKSTAE